MYLLKGGTGTHPLPFFMADSSDHVTGKTGLSPTVVLRKEGGSFFTPAGTVSEVGNGFYEVAGNGTDQNNLGALLLYATAAGADPCAMGYQLVYFDPDNSANLGLSSIPAAAADSVGGLPVLSAGPALAYAVASVAAINTAGGKAAASLDAGDVTGNLPANVLTWSGAAVTLDGTAAPVVGTCTNVLFAASCGTVTDLVNLPNIPNGWLTAAGIAAGAFTSGKFAAGALDAVWGTAVRSLTDKAGFALGAAYDAAKTAAQAGNAMTLTAGERTAIANEVEAQIIDETDSEKVLTAITNKIASVNPSLAGLTTAAIAAAVWANATRSLTDKAGFTINGAVVSLDALLVALAAAHGAGAWSTATGFAVPGDAMTLTVDERATTAAVVRTDLDASSTRLAAIKAKTDNLPATPASAGNVTAAQVAIIAAIPTDYQQRATAVTLPDPAPAGYGGDFSGTISGLTDDQAAMLERAAAFAAGKRVRSIVGGLETLTVYAADGVTPLYAFSLGPEGGPYTTLTPVSV